MTEVNKYNHSKIYKICSNLTDKIYIGSTTQTLAKRLYAHVLDYKQYIITNTKYITSYEIIKLEDYYITLIEEHNFNNRQQLLKREGEIIKLNINNVVNKQITGRTNAEYRVDNVEHIKRYSQDNKEHIIEYKKQYHINNREQILEKQKQYNINNKQVILEQKKQPIICECGIIYTRCNKLQHMKSTKHINLINQQILLNNELTFYNF